MCQSRPADPMDPGDAADLSIMGLLWASKRRSVCLAATVAHGRVKINRFLTTPAESNELR
ncbi:hypothetical protein C7I85_15840 [Mesorhizobium soli]|uniref:Uncharacterized protein n=1 Tax=Pseudaminobacter soli (ex Li et al. 2025) TaxID=1295366 RepID=A0A2P7SBD5_9HYPH|nr:hypothetical protein C7I85_15840 [Mesorhizobium soli]